MDKYDFIENVIAIYPHAITDKKAQYNIYDRALSTDNVDYDKLMDLFAEEYTDSFPPPSGYLRNLSERCLKKKVPPSAKWLQVRVYNPFYKKVLTTDCFPNGTTEEQMLKYYQKRFGGEGWRIVEVY